MRARLKSALDLGLVWAWAPENSPRRRIGCARAQWIRGVSRRLGSSRPRFPSLWCRVRVETPRSANPAQPRWPQRGSCPRSPSGKAGEWRSGRGAAATYPKHALAARPAVGRSHARRRSGPGSPQPIHAFLHSDALVRPRRARPERAGRRAGDTPPPDYDSASPRSSSAAMMAPDSDCCFPGEASARWRPTRRLLLVPSERPTRLAGDDRFHGKQQRCGRSASSVRTAQFHGKEQSRRPTGGCSCQAPKARVRQRSRATRSDHAIAQATPSITDRRDVRQCRGRAYVPHRFRRTAFASAGRHFQARRERRRRRRICLVATATALELPPMGSSQTATSRRCNGCHASVGVALPFVHAGDYAGRAEVRGVTELEEVAGAIDEMAAAVESDVPAPHGGRRRRARPRWPSRSKSRVTGRRSGRSSSRSRP